MSKYDYLIVGAGLTGAVCAYKLLQNHKSVLIIDKRNHVGGNCYTKEHKGIMVHQYGAHIFHTSNQKIWEFVQRFSDFNHYVNRPIANYKNEIYNLPFNMNTFSKLWKDVITPEQAKIKIEQQRILIEQPKNLEEQALSLVGKDIYEKLIKGYTEKQWGKKCCELAPEIIKRIPLRFTYDNNYFNDTYQGIPTEGYTSMIEKMMIGADIQLGVDYLENRSTYENIAHKIIYTGPIDAYFNYCFGNLEWRSLDFRTVSLECSDFQGNAVVNYTGDDVKYTRIIEHKHFVELNGNITTKNTIITYEYSGLWKIGDEPYYPVNNARNTELYNRYKQLAENEKNTIFIGRLAEYKYYDMDDIIENVLYKEI